jgi:hypothetical protein
MACEHREGSQFWRSLQDIKHEIRMGVTHSIGDGEGTLLWLDSWLGGRPLRLDFPQLFTICSDPMLLMATAGHGMWDIPFRRVFGPEETIEWEALRARLPDTLSESPDSVSWHLSTLGIFMVKSAYRSLRRGPAMTWTTPCGKPHYPLRPRYLCGSCLGTASPQRWRLQNDMGQVMASFPFVPSRRRYTTLFLPVLLPASYGVSLPRP